MNYYGCWINSDLTATSIIKGGVKYITGTQSGSGTTAQERITNFLNAITTDGYLCHFDVNIAYAGSFMIIGYLYPNKDYGAGAYLGFDGSFVYWRKYNNTLHFNNVQMT